MKYTTCHDRLRLATDLFPIIVPRSIDTKTEFSRYVDLSKAKRSAHYTYFVIARCDLEYEPRYPPPFTFDATFLNGSSHLPADEEGTYPFFICITLVLVGISALYIYGLTNVYKKYTQLHFISLLLGLALLFQLSASIAQVIHMSKYLEDGKGYKLRHTWLAIDFFAEMAQLGSELIIAFILICIALGWLFSYSFRMSHILFSTKPRVVFILLVCTHVFLQHKGRRYFEDFNHFHDFSHWPGLVLVLLRLILCAIFWIGVGIAQGNLPDFVRRSPIYGAIFGTVFGLVSRDNSTPAVPASVPQENNTLLSASSASSSSSSSATVADSIKQTRPVFQGRTDGYARDVEPEIVKLITIITACGTIWFLSFPFLVITAPLFAAVDQKAYVGWGSVLIHIIVLLFFLYSFGSPNSAFFKNTSLKNMGTVFASNDGLGQTSSQKPSKLSFIKKAALD